MVRHVGNRQEAFGPLHPRLTATAASTRWGERGAKSPPPYRPSHRVTGVFVAVLTLLLATPATAHPHVWIQARSTVVVDDAAVVAVRHSWTFDRLFSAHAVADLLPGPDGAWSQADLQPLADLYAETLPPWRFFTELRAEVDPAPTLAARPMWLEHDGQRLTLHLDLDVTPPVPVAAFDQLRVHDRTYYVSIAYAGADAVELVGAPGCSLYLHPPGQLDPALTARLAAVPADVRELPPELAARVRDAATRLELDCT